MNTDTETWLDELQLKWEHEPALSIDDIDAVKSLTNQARVKPLEETVVERYTLDMQAGDVFPPIVVHRRSKGSKLTMIGGNHRFAAARKAGLDTIEAYIVEADPETVTRMTYEDNRRHGIPPSDDERIAHATHLVDMGWKQEPAARCVGISVQKLNRAIAVTRVDRRALELGVDVQKFTTLPRSSRWRLGAIKSDPVFVAASKLALDAKLGSEEIYPLATTLNAARSEASALDHISAARDKHASRIRNAGKKATTNPARIKLGDACIVITTISPTEVHASCASDDQRRALTRRCSEAVVALTKVIALIGERKAS